MPGQKRSWGRGRTEETTAVAEASEPVAPVETPEFSDVTGTTETSEPVAVETPETPETPEAVEVEVETENATDTNKTAPRARVKAEDLGTVSAFEEDDEAPLLTKNRSRNNPYDAPVWMTFEQEYAKKTSDKPQGRWVKQTVGNVDAAMRLIRNAAEHCNIGAEIRSALDNDNDKFGSGTVWFRGKQKREVKRTAKQK